MSKMEGKKLALPLLDKQVLDLRKWKIYMPCLAVWAPHVKNPLNCPGSFFRQCKSYTRPVDFRTSGGPLNEPVVSPVLGRPFVRLQAFALELKGFLALRNCVRYQGDVRVPIGSSLRKLLDWEGSSVLITTPS